MFNKALSLSIIGVDQDIPERPDQQADGPDVHLARHLPRPPPAAHRRVPPLDAEGEELRREDEQNVSRRFVRIRNLIHICLPEVLVTGSSLV